MTDAEFLAALESCALPEAEFDHRGHLRAAWLCLRGGSFPEALARMSAALKRYSTHMGKPGRYHETITVAHMAVINERLHAGGAQDSWSAFLRDNPDLGQESARRRAETKMMGTSAEFWKWRRASRPSMPGRPTSSKIRSGGSRRARARPSSALAAVLAR